MAVPRRTRSRVFCRRMNYFLAQWESNSGAAFGQHAHSPDNVVGKVEKASGKTPGNKRRDKRTQSVDHERQSRDRMRNTNKCDQNIMFLRRTYRGLQRLRPLTRADKRARCGWWDGRSVPRWLPLSEARRDEANEAHGPSILRRTAILPNSQRRRWLASGVPPLESMVAKTVVSSMKSIRSPPIRTSQEYSRSSTRPCAFQGTRRRPFVEMHIPLPRKLALNPRAFRPASVMPFSRLNP